MKLAPKLLVGLAASVCVAAAATSAPVDPALHDKALEILKKGVAFRTVAGGGQMQAYGEYLKGVLVAGGYAPAEVTVEPLAGSAVLVARYPGTDPQRKPILISGHMDVVEAKPQDWERDPFTAVVENGYVYGRGASDNKFDVSMVVATLARLRAEGWRPGRDVILALSGDEETTMATSAVLAQRFANAELVINVDGGGGLLREDGKPAYYGIQGAEKSYADFTLSVTDPGGHSSRPTPTNPIYRLATRARPDRGPPLSGHVERDHASVVRRHGGRIPRRDGRGDEALRGGPDRRGGDPRARDRPQQRRHAAHHLRGDDAERRSRAQRAAAAGRGRGQLPHLPGHLGRGDRQDPGAGRGRRRPSA